MAKVSSLDGAIVSLAERHLNEIDYARTVAQKKRNTEYRRLVETS